MKFNIFKDFNWFNNHFLFYCRQILICKKSYDKNSRVGLLYTDIYIQQFTTLILANLYKKKNANWSWNVSDFLVVNMF